MKFFLTGIFFIAVSITATSAFSAIPDTTPSSVIKVVRIVGVSRFQEAELLKLLNDITGREVSYEQLEKAVDRISAYYEERSRTVMVTMPRQDISDGIVLYRIVEFNKEITQSTAGNEKSVLQRLMTRSMQSGPMTRALSGQFSHGAYYLIKPTLTVSEQYIDNINETRDSHQSDLITSVTPAINIQYSAKRWDWNLGYSPTYRNFLHNSRGDELINSASLAGKIRLIDNFLFLDVSDSYRRTSIDTNRESLFANQTDVNTFFISPHVKYQLAPRWTANGGYSYTNRSTPGSALAAIETHSLFLALSRQMSNVTSLFTGASWSKNESGDDTRFSRVLHYAGIQHNFSSGSFITARGGYSLFLPQAGGSSLSSYWDINLGYLWRSYTLSVSSGVSHESQLAAAASETMFIGATLAKAYRRGVIRVLARWSQFTDNQLNTTQGQWFSTGADATYELTRRATATASIITDRYRTEAEYRNSFTMGVNYQLFYDLSLSAAYNRNAYSSRIFAPTGSVEVNRLYVSVTKSF